MRESQVCLRVRQCFMTATKADIVARLQKEILSLQGLKKHASSSPLDLALGPIKQAFPNQEFPIGAVHEFIFTGTEDAAATFGFVSGILSQLMLSKNACVWIGAREHIFPPALSAFGIDPGKIIFINLQKEKQITWAFEEALKCTSLAAVIGELPELSFIASRRLQLAVEQSQVTGFLLRNNPRNLATTACVTRWQIHSLPGIVPANLPGVGFPCWQVSLLKVRNGKPGSWQVQYAGNKFRFLTHTPVMLPIPQKKTG